MARLTFSVRGLPVPQGSARAFVVKGRAVVATDANDPKTPLGSWRSNIAKAAGEAMGDAPAWTGPVTVTVWFVFPRPKSHYLPAGRRRPSPEIRLDAPRFVTSKPDVDKLLRALLDGITNVVVRDDAQVAGVRAWKTYEDDADYAPLGVTWRPGCHVEIDQLKETR